MEIWEIQGTGNASPVLGQLVASDNNVVTAVGENFFFIQTPTERSDDNVLTSDALYIYTGFPTGLNIGQLVNVSGIVREFDGLTEISGPELEFNATGQTASLPDPILLTTSFPGTAAATVRDLERVENMRIAFDATVVAPTLGNGIAGLSTAAERPFREPGIRFPGQDNLPVWDGNPEIFWLDTDALSQPNNRFLSFGQAVSASGVLYQSDDLYIAFPTTYSVSGDVAERDLRTAAPDEISIGSINVLQLREDSDLLDIQFSKIAKYIVDRLGAPDIIALQEVGDLDVLHELNLYINQLNPLLRYDPYLIQGNNNTSINVAYLVSDRMQDVTVNQLGAIETISIGGRLHDRPPLLLEANLPTNPPTPIKVLNLHMRSLSGIEGSNSFYVRTKRYEQSLSVAEMIQDRQADNLFVVGDFNALPFTDGYVDMLSQLEGTFSLGAEYEVQPIVSPPLVNYAAENTPTERYSFVFDGSAQLIDHCLSTTLTNLAVTEFAFARGNADAASAYYPNPNLSTRASDHDGFVLYVRPDAPIVSSIHTPANMEDWSVANPQQPGAMIQLPGEMNRSEVILVDAQGRLINRWDDAVAQIKLPELANGFYLLLCTNGQTWQRAKIIVQE